MCFNPDNNKQVNEVYLSNTSRPDGYLPIYLNNNLVQLCQSRSISASHLSNFWRTLEMILIN